MWLSCREVRYEVLGFCVPWGNRVSGAAWEVASYSFPPLSEKPSSSHSNGGVGLSFCQEQWGVLGLCILWEGSLLVPGQNSEAWSLRFTSVCGGRLPTLCRKLRVHVGQQGQQPWIVWCPQESGSPGVYLCWVWVSTSHDSCCSHRRTKPVGSGSSTAQFSAWASGGCSFVVLFPTRLRRTKPVGSGSSGAWSPSWASGSSVLWCCYRGKQACWLAPSVIQEAVGAPGTCLYRGASFPGVSG
jgi:hypothetical protein